MEGEVKEVKKVAIAVLAMAFFMLTLAVVPAWAGNSKWIPVVITRTSLITTGTRWYTEGDTYHLRDSVSLSLTYSITGTGISYVGSSHATFEGNLNLKTGEGSSTWHSEILLPGGGFKGIIHIRGTCRVISESYSNVGLRGYILPINATLEGQWAGFGDYVGQKLVLEYDIVNTVQPSTLNGYLFIP